VRWGGGAGSTTSPGIPPPLPAAGPAGSMLTMATVWLVLRADVRRQWRALLGLVLLLGLAGGVVLTAAAGARRTDTAYPRLLTWANASQVEVAPGEPDPAYFAALARLPQVAGAAPVNQYTVALPVPHGTPDAQVQALSSPNGAYGASVDRVKIVAGRMFSATATDEAVIDPQLAGMEHLRPGGTLLSQGQANTGCVHGITCYDFFLLRYRPGTGTAATATRLLAATAAAGCPFSACTVISDQQPGDIRDYAAIRDTPVVLGAVLAVLAIGTLAHVLLTGVRRRRRDVAVLKTLGLTRSQVQGMVAWEATALAAVALLIGIPVGVVAGRWAWTLFASTAGVATQATVQVSLVLLAIPATLAVANLIAVWPGWRAARLRPATVLRTE
jgi:FtsX-like permease family